MASGQCERIDKSAQIQAQRYIYTLTRYPLLPLVAVTLQPPLYRYWQIIIV